MCDKETCQSFGARAEHRQQGQLQINFVLRNETKSRQDAMKLSELWVSDDCENHGIAAYRGEGGGLGFLDVAMSRLSTSVEAKKEPFDVTGAFAGFYRVTSLQECKKYDQ